MNSGNKCKITIIILLLYNVQNMSIVHYKVNCAFARVAMRDYSEVGRGKGKCDTAVRMYKFKELFSSQTNYV